MKKTLAVVLSLLVAFSMLTVMASAADLTEEDLAKVVTVKFVYQTETDEEVIETIYVAPGTGITPELVPDIVNEFKTEKDGKTFKYTFKGWKSSVDGSVYYDAGIPTPTEDQAGATIVYSAEYAKEDYSERQSLWNLIESIFERINKIFEYFATIFNW